MGFQTLNQFYSTVQHSSFDTYFHTLMTQAAMQGAKLAHQPAHQVIHIHTSLAQPSRVIWGLALSQSQVRTCQHADWRSWKSNCQSSI